MANETVIRVGAALQDPRVWKPSVAEIVERTGLDPRTVRGVLNSFLENDRVSISVSLNLQGAQDPPLVTSSKTFYTSTGWKEKKQREARK